MRALTFIFGREPNASETVWKGLLGVGGTLTGVGVSLAQVEAWLRVSSLAVGIAVGIATFISIVRNRKK